MRKSLLSAVALTALVAFSGSAWADILVGVAGPITGPNAAFGAQLQKGAEQAVAGILEITPAATNPKFTERGMWNTFRTCGRDDQQGKVAGDYLAANFKDAKIAVIHDKTPYGQGLADETKKALAANGVTEAMYEGINVGDKDFSALIAKMKDAGVSVVYYGGLHTEAGLIIRQLADQGLKATFMSGDGIVSNELASIAGDAVDGTLMTFAPDPRKNPNAKELVEKFRAAGFEPEAYTLYSYAAMEIIAAAIAKTGSADDAQKVAETIKSAGPWKTTIGEIGYDAKGDITRPDYVMYTWKKGDDGKYTYVENAPGK
ncbi:MAG: branched-chain amino acid ABC transporter substrate-binding protein [Mesorhizobium sp.]|nr:MAG: branched-chain amino acid ABC transporter substrate-binding protein [Mesorhizobium sp.]